MCRVLSNVFYLLITVLAYFVKNTTVYGLLSAVYSVQFTMYFHRVLATHVKQTNNKDYLEIHDSIMRRRKK